MFDNAEQALSIRIARSVDAIQRSFLDNLFYVVGRTLEDASPVDHYTALAYTIRDRLLARFVSSTERYRQSNARTVAYLSAEFLLGPHLGNNILNLDAWGNTMDHTREALLNLGLDLDIILESELEPGLGNGGLGRLAACYMDSLATLEIPAIGYGIRYEYGIFDQEIRDGWQIEIADAWLRNGNPWELPNRQIRYPVKMDGYLESNTDETNQSQVRWNPSTCIYGLAYDTPILGYGVSNANLLRLWKSEAREPFDLLAFSQGDYQRAVSDNVVAENISKVLYPNDEPEIGKELRLRQQYFFVSCSLQDMIQMTLREQGKITDFANKFVAQLNDTHPAIAIPELMRLLVDEHQVDWESAWSLTRRTFAYTNHTLLPEALETWSLPLFQRILPRHLDIIYNINARFMDEMRWHFQDDNERLSRISLIDETGEKRVRMANLACVGSFAINGVAALHTDLLKKTVLQDFYKVWPEKFNNKTNGVTPRRFIALANPSLTHLINSSIGPGWLRDLEQLRNLEPHSDDASFRLSWRKVKRAAKANLSDYILQITGIAVDPDSLFDVQAKRIHEYKRQHLNVLQIINLYNQLKQNPHMEMAPRTFIFSGKAAPSYHMAKLIIKLINSVAEVINRDPQINERLKVVFVPNMNVKLGQRLYPAADLSEQISTAGMEASGTGNMKFAMNGALTIGTLDGANVEIREAVGAENFFLFGLSVDQVQALLANGYRSRDLIEQTPSLREALYLLSSGLFSHGDKDLFAPFLNNIWNHDPYLICADFVSYASCQQNVNLKFTDCEDWSRMSILNVARMGKFSSDRAIREYCEDIWKTAPISMSQKSHRV
ncbi:glycogen/starch/alpha-glucan phosphorylase [Methylomonas sp. AM2-LC]|uniref:glycogen/starch/alpha-glucan phosphorylase n=1 Tax=Methylomonas sp. AM2-LC TaxID=3153301 RepID=UPI0032653022